MSHSNAYELSREQRQVLAYVSGLLMERARWEQADPADENSTAQWCNRLFEAFPALRAIRSAAVECDGCHLSGGDVYLSGVSIRQKPDGSLICLWCGREVVPAESADVP